MAVASATTAGAPSLRMVLLKSFDEYGLVFFTHMTSRKGRELIANPRAALLLYWDSLGRQVRVGGDAEQVEGVRVEGAGRGGVTAYLAGTEDAEALDYHVYS